MYGGEEKEFKSKGRGRIQQRKKQLFKPRKKERVGEQLAV